MEAFLRVDITQDRIGLSGLAPGFGYVGTPAMGCGGFESRTVHHQN